MTVVATESGELHAPPQHRDPEADRDLTEANRRSATNLEVTEAFHGEHAASSDRQPGRPSKVWSLIYDPGLI